ERPRPASAPTVDPVSGATGGTVVVVTGAGVVVTLRRARFAVVPPPHPAASTATPIATASAAARRAPNLDAPGVDAGRRRLTSLRGGGCAPRAWNASLTRRASRSTGAR